MITKTIGTLLLLVVCIMFFPIAFAILGGVFGIVAGVLGAVFGGIIGAIGGVFGAIFGIFEWIFDGLFNWHWPFGFFGCNDMFMLGLVIVIVALAVRSKQGRN
jgi:hypothetical protein